MGPLYLPLPTVLRPSKDSKPLSSSHALLPLNLKCGPGIGIGPNRARPLERSS